MARKEYEAIRVLRATTVGSQVGTRNRVYRVGERGLTNEEAHGLVTANYAKEASVKEFETQDSDRAKAHAKAAAAESKDKGGPSENKGKTDGGKAS